ncbi:MAG: hypothetical protein AAGA38_02910 [Pseudomonadota bacterium]
MNKVVGHIAITLGADVSGLLRGTDRSRRATNKFGGDFQKTLRRVRNVASLAAVAMAGIATAGKVDCCMTPSVGDMAILSQDGQMSVTRCA